VRTKSDIKEVAEDNEEEYIVPELKLIMHTILITKLTKMKGSSCCRCLIDIGLAFDLESDQIEDHIEVEKGSKCIGVVEGGGGGCGGNFGAVERCGNSFFSIQNIGCD
jgi:hypothetical protein